MQSHIKFGKLLGIPLRVDLTWLLIFAWATWSLSTSMVPAQMPEASTLVDWVVGTALSFLFFFSVILHELGHSLVARAQGQQVKQITLFIFGGASEITEEPDTPRRELAMSIAGPGVSLALGGLFLLIGHLGASVDWLRTMGTYLGQVNLALGIFNLIPGFPLDGGRVLRAIIWARTHSLTVATRWAANAGRVIAYLIMVLGMFVALRGDFGSGLWLLLVGSFMDTSARSTFLRMNIDQVLEGHTVAEVMTGDCPILPPQLTVDLFIEHYVTAQGKRCYFVGGRDHPTGMITVHQVQGLPRNKWPETHIGDIANALGDLRTVTPETPLLDVLQEMSEEGVNQLPVLTDGELAGMVTREGLLTFMRAHSAFSAK